MKEPAIGLLELIRISRGILVCDAITKKAPVRIIQSTPVCPGKYAILFTGDEASVEESLNEGIKISGDALIDSLFLPNVHKQISPAISGTTKVDRIESVGILEAFSIASAVVAADMAVKEALVQLIELRLAVGLGGKAYFTLTGNLYDVEASVAKAKEFLKKEGTLIGAEIIAAPHNDLNGVLL